MNTQRTKIPLAQTWTAMEALSWGMFGDETKLTLSFPVRVASVNTAITSIQTPADAEVEAAPPQAAEAPPPALVAAAEFTAWPLDPEATDMSESEPASATVGITTPTNAKFPTTTEHSALPTPHRTYDTARSELCRALAEGKVGARGFRVNHNQPPVAREPLLPDLFVRFPALTVDAMGETTFMHPARPQNIPSWQGIVFVKDEIRALWPKPMLNLDRWMQQSVATHPDEKRDSRLSDCRNETGCTVREAKDAFGRLPSNTKRGRGQKIKSRL